MVDTAFGTGWLGRRLSLVAILSGMAGVHFPTGCKDERRPPFYTPARVDDGRDASLTDAIATPRLPRSGQDPPRIHSEQPAGCESGPELRVLFIGNSHTYSNDLPALVRDMACAAGTKVITRSATPGGVTFIDHAADPATLEAIAADRWDIVVLQDQQQFPGFRLDDVDADEVPAVRSLVDAITANRADTRRLFFMVWARRDGDAQNCDYYPLVCSFEGFTRAVSEGYRLFADRTDSELASVALAWAAVLDDTDSRPAGLELFADDGSHPALAGSYLAAAVLVGSMLERETSPLAFTSGLSEPVAEYLRGMADRVVSADRADPRVSTAERVRISCDLETGCAGAADASPVTITLSSDSCAELLAGSASVKGRIATTASCRNGACVTPPLGGWHSVAGEVIEDGSYQVHVKIDNGANDVGGGNNLEACSEGAFEVGSGTDLSVSEFRLR